VGELEAAIESFRRTMGIVSDRKHQIEVHADGYPPLDLRQLATLETMGNEISEPRWADMPLTILTEVASLYPSRGIDGTPEVLITAGKSAFGRVSDCWNISHVIFD
jgi:D-serine ammonia-lyase